MPVAACCLLLSAAVCCCMLLPCCCLLLPAVACRCLAATAAWLILLMLLLLLLLMLLLPKPVPKNCQATARQLPVFSSDLQPATQPQINANHVICKSSFFGGFAHVDLH